MGQKDGTVAARAATKQSKAESDPATITRRVSDDNVLRSLTAPTEQEVRRATSSSAACLPVGSSEEQLIDPRLSNQMIDIHTVVSELAASAAKLANIVVVAHGTPHRRSTSKDA